MWREIGASHTDRPSEAASGSVGHVRVEFDACLASPGRTLAPRWRPTARRPVRRRPREVADGLHDVGAVPDEPVDDRGSMTSCAGQWSARRSRLDRWRRVECSSRGRAPSSRGRAASRSHRVDQSRRHRCRTFRRVSMAASRVIAADSHCDGSRPCRSMKSSIFVVESVLDLDGALREHPQHVLRDAGDLGLAVHDRFPLEAEAVGEFVADHRLVDAAEHPLVLLHVLAVERDPATVGGADLVRDDAVGVEVGVVGSRRRLAELGHREAARVGVESDAGSLLGLASSSRTVRGGRARR